MRASPVIEQILAAWIEAAVAAASGAVAVVERVHVDCTVPLRSLIMAKNALRSLGADTV